VDYLGRRFGTGSSGRENVWRNNLVLSLNALATAMYRHQLIRAHAAMLTGFDQELFQRPHGHGRSKDAHLPPNQLGLVREDGAVDTMKKWRERSFQRPTEASSYGST
jgi:hypothetical protein